MWEERESGELPDFNVNKAMSMPRCHRCEGSRPSQGQTNQGFEEMQGDKVELWNEKEPLGLPQIDKTSMNESQFHWYEGSRPDPKMGKAQKDPVQLMEDDLELDGKNAREIK